MHIMIVLKTNTYDLIRFAYDRYNGFSLSGPCQGIAAAKSDVNLAPLLSSCTKSLK